MTRRSSNRERRTGESDPDGRMGDELGRRQRRSGDERSGERMTGKPREGCRGEDEEGGERGRSGDEAD